MARARASASRQKKQGLEDLVIVVDSREQKPYKFEGRKTVSRYLETGDYSILGLEDAIAIERKSKNDAYSTIGKGRKRFTRELERLAKIDYSAIVIESSVRAFLIPPGFSELNPKAAINSLLAWSVRYGVKIWFADTRLIAQTLTVRLLEKYYLENLAKQRNEKEGEK